MSPLQTLLHLKLRRKAVVKSSEVLNPKITLPCDRSSQDQFRCGSYISTLIVKTRFFYSCIYWVRIVE